MCGRYQLVLPLEEVLAAFDAESESEPFPPRYNIAPTQPIHVVRLANRTRTLSLMRWGLLPSWVKEPQKFPLLINARVETAAEKPAFRNAVRRRRALIPATGFYEWRREDGVKQPFFFEPDAPIAFAGVWETWMGPNGEEMDTAAILTSDAQGIPADYHDRMPLTVPRDNVAAWLDPDNENGEEALRLTGKARFRARPVSRRLSNARNEGVGLMTPDPVAPPPEPEATDTDDQPRLL
ncbi:MAG: SOS response-associated peptidase [Acuticoccus sp.]